MKSSLAQNVKELQIDRKIEGVRTGSIVGVDENGQVLVDFTGNTLGPLKAKFTTSIKEQLYGQSLEGCPVLLVFENNDPNMPVIIDTLHTAVAETQDFTCAFNPVEMDHIQVDGKRINFNADEQLVLKCGKSSITLTRAGKIILRGAYLLNRSSGVNQIKGASVRIN